MSDSVDSERITAVALSVGGRMRAHGRTTSLSTLTQVYAGRISPDELHAAVALLERLDIIEQVEPGRWRAVEDSS